MDKIIKVAEETVQIGNDTLMELNNQTMQINQMDNNIEKVGILNDYSSKILNKMSSWFGIFKPSPVIPLEPIIQVVTIPNNLILTIDHQKDDLDKLSDLMSDMKNIGKNIGKTIEEQTERINGLDLKVTHETHIVTNNTKIIKKLHF